MNQLIQSKNFRTFIVLAAALVGFALMPMAQAVGPDTEGAIAGSNNGEGIGVWSTALLGSGTPALGSRRLTTSLPATKIRRRSPGPV
jgi:hypothetical protein